MLQRYAMEKQKLHRKNNIYNLEDEDLEDFEDSLGEIDNSIDTINLDDKSNSEGDIDFETVDEKHFGGFKDLELNKKKTKSEIMKEIIAKSKLQKYQRQKIKEDDDIERETLDAEINDLRLLLSKNNEIIFPATEKTQLNKDIQYDLDVKELAYEKRACPSSRTKTDEEIAREKAEELHRLEEERIKRMKYENFSDEDIEEVNFFSPKNDNFKNDFIINNDNPIDNNTDFCFFQKETPQKSKHKEIHNILQCENGMEDTSILNKNEDITKNISTYNNIVSEFSNIISTSSDNLQNLYLDTNQQKLPYIYP
ncbi:hypothetical protein PCK2_001025, partial [Pneumocystis canis]